MGSDPQHHVHIGSVNWVIVGRSLAVFVEAIRSATFFPGDIFQAEYNKSGVLRQTRLRRHSDGMTTSSNWMQRHVLPGCCALVEDGQSGIHEEFEFRTVPLDAKCYLPGVFRTNIYVPVGHRKL